MCGTVADAATDACKMSLLNKKRGTGVFSAEYVVSFVLEEREN